MAGPGTEPEPGPGPPPLRCASHSSKSRKEHRRKTCRLLLSVLHSCFQSGWMVSLAVGVVPTRRSSGPTQLYTWAAGGHTGQRSLRQSTVCRIRNRSPLTVRRAQVFRVNFVLYKCESLSPGDG